MASASTSTRISGEMSRLTSTKLVAGRMLPNTSPCTRPMASHAPMSTTYMRVRTTCSSPAPARSSAARMLSSTWRICAAGSPTPTMPPSGPVAVVPETWTKGPTRTARE
jgi:hypothetical protein